MTFFTKAYSKLLTPYHYFWAFFSALIFGFPGKKIKIIGVTGTKGKSTTVELANKILEKAGYTTAFLSSIKIKIGDKEQKNYFKMTMPGRWHVQKFLKDAVKNRCQYVILEVTSEGILQYRHKFIDFDIVLFTNLSPEHIERHGSFEKYRATKIRIFRENKNNHILNLDDKNVEKFLDIVSDKKIGFTIKENAKFEFSALDVVRATGVTTTKEYSSFLINNELFKINLLGEFNVYNAIAAICIALSQKVSLQDCNEALSEVENISGRMEIVIEKPFKVIVDYAHTPDSLESVYKAGLQLKSETRKIICVLGSAGGGRDKWKRPKMGEIAGKYCDNIILTNEDPYDENPLDILSMVKSGIQNFNSQNLLQIIDRREAITKALAMAQENDIVIITGKGSEPWMCVKNGKKVPWDDREIVRQEFQKLDII
jgi:UDP-N-acetylmuramoyl-L-alanyl-D-glutamate--2,6-diaminopimelate ligase